MISDKIVNYIKCVCCLLDANISCFEVHPISLKGEFFITGFRFTKDEKAEAHIKHYKYFKLNTIEGVKMELKQVPENEMWIDCSLLDENALTKAFIEAKSVIPKMTNCEIAHITHKPKNASKDSNLIEETILFESKKIAYREVMNIKRNSSEFHVKFTHMSDNYPQKETHVITDEEFADMAIE